MITNLLLFIYVFILPGYLFTRVISFKLGSFERTAIALGSTMLILPLLNFSLAWIFQTYIRLELVIMSTSIINLILAAIILSRNEKHRKIEFSIRHVFMLLLCVLVFFVHFTNFEGPSQDYWSTYIVGGSMFMNNDKIEFVDISGMPLYDYHLKGSIPENLVDASNFGVITKDQRIGAAITYSLPYLIFGLAGYRIFHSLFIVVGFLLMISLIKHFFDSDILAIFIGLIISLNPLLLYFNRLNANIVGMVILLLVLFFLIKKKNYMIAGIFFGILGGVRNVAILFIPAILFFLLAYKKNNRIKRLGCFFIGALIMILPILLWKSFAFGSILAHPTQYGGLYGHRPEFEHNFFGINAKFNGMFNYPFSEKLVRTPHFPFPNYITIPLLLFNSFGLILSGFAILGIYYIQKNRATGTFFGLLFLIFFVFLMIQENWEELKSSFVILLLPCLGIFIASGIKNTINQVSKKKFTSIISLAIIFLILVLFVTSLKGLDIEKDQRWYERFPHSTTEEITIKDLPERYRLDWQFFYTDETKEEKHRMKEKYTQINIFPQLYGDLHISKFSSEDFANNMDKKYLKTLEVWNYIYG